MTSSLHTLDPSEDESFRDDLEDSETQLATRPASLSSGVPKLQLETLAVDIKPPNEIRRKNLRSRINQLESEVVLKIPSGDALSLFESILQERKIELDEAETEGELRALGVALNQTEKSIRHREAKIRSGTLVARIVIGVGLLLLVGGLAILAYWGTRDSGPSSETMVPVLDLPLPVLLWGLIGSLVAMLYRVSVGGDDTVPHPSRWLVTRPFVGVMTAVTCYFVLEILLAMVPSTTEVAPIVRNLSWLIALFAGLSDRLSTVLMSLVVGRVRPVETAVGDG